MLFSSEEMEVELQRQDFKAIENMETNLRLQKNEVCVHCPIIMKNVCSTLSLLQGQFKERSEFWKIYPIVTSFCY